MMERRPQSALGAGSQAGAHVGTEQHWVSVSRQFPMVERWVHFPWFLSQKPTVIK